MCQPMLPEWPVYIVSKGRSDSRLTSKTLEAMRVPYHIVVESQEYDQYADVIDPAKILVLDPDYQRDYDTCDDLGASKSKGPGPARNFVWDHAGASGAEWHWVMDDNIHGFVRLNHNARLPMFDGTCLRVMEDFCERYANVAMAGPNYRYFVNGNERRPIVLNTRIYSCNLIRNDVPFRWRARYNEDTVLSLDMLKAGWCTVQFNAFLQNKITTQAMRGGCTDDFYIPEGTLPKSQMQVRLHPDVSRLVWKYGRWHHHVDYSRFKRNKLIRKPDVEITPGVSEYGMRLVRIDSGRQAVKENA